MCTLSRVLVAAWVVGVSVATLTGSDVAGWAAAIAAGAATALWLRRRWGAACPPGTDACATTPQLDSTEAIPSPMREERADSAR